MALAAGDPLWYYKVLGLHCDGANNSTTFTDVKGKTITANGNAKISTAQYPSLTGKTSSAYFDGTGDYLSLTNNISMVGSDLTIDLLVYFNTAPTTTSTAYDLFKSSSVSTGIPTFAIWQGQLQFNLTNVAIADSGVLSWSTGQWYHLSAVKIGNSYKIYRDGTQVASATNSTTIISPTGNYTIGTNINGYASEIQVYVGVGTHTANFTPTSAPFPDTYVRVSGTTRDSSGTLASRLVRVYRRDTGAYVGASVADETSGEWVVVAANSGTTTPIKHFAIAHDAPGNPYGGTFLFAMRMNDASLSDETGRTVTIAGNATRSSTQSKFGGYSAYFDGTGDYLSIQTASAIGTGDFTLEAWIYVTTPASTFLIFDNRTSDIDANGFAFYVRSTSKLTVIIDGTAYEGTTTVTGGVWHHVSLCRSGTSVRAFLDGNLESTTTKSNNFSRTTCLLGHQWNVSGTFSSGYIDDAFCLSGAAARTESFTPPSGKFAYILPSATENAQIYDDITPY